MNYCDWYKHIGGSTNSKHCLGRAVDIEVPGISNIELATWIRDNLDYDKLILECYRQGEPRSGWVHVGLAQSHKDNRNIALTYSNRVYSQGLVA
ncbi:hypothetical protein DBZ36_08080 [Alginatibacterium sediminis]|uniref:Peptidase M15A C-terminal domain-containing protein n=1 Tax=Alginatibacterium sediminis TaxID=2164068 RepID=A0A420EIJ2_9ALTE|nr:D-Ala-D-Ala carboxypeptidase family metallohydrolase [Alginatibacterium sediminis]RKF20386.1 hypothetical protein DBZ36_08080 [Alginatibacterium sediminis]